MKKVKINIQPTVKKRTNKNLNPLVILFFAILILYSLSLIFPLIWGLMTSLKHYMDFGVHGNTIGFPNFSLWSKYASAIAKGDYAGYDNIFGNYLIVIRNFKIKKMQAIYYTGIFTQREVIHTTSPGLLNVFINTLLYCAGGCLLPTFMCCFMGYVCAKYKYKFSTVIYSIVVFVMVMPIVGNQPAMISFLRTIGFYDNFLGHMIRQANFTSMYFLVFYAFYQGLSDSYLEAAQIDGASQLRIMISIATPLAKTMITTIILILFVASWNDYEVPLLYLPTQPTLAYAVYYLTTKGNTKFNRVPMRIASLMFLAVPSLLIFITLNDKLMGNVSLGGIKE